MRKHVSVPVTREKRGILIIERDSAGAVIWTDEMDEIIRKGLENNWSMSKIASTFGFTKNVICGRVFRLRKLGLAPVSEKGKNYVVAG